VLLSLVFVNLDYSAFLYESGIKLRILLLKTLAAK